MSTISEGRFSTFNEDAFQAEVRKREAEVRKAANVIDEGEHRGVKANDSGQAPQTPLHGSASNPEGNPPHLAGVEPRFVGDEDDDIDNDNPSRQKTKTPQDAANPISSGESDSVAKAENVLMAKYAERDRMRRAGADRVALAKSDAEIASWERTVGMMRSPGIVSAEQYYARKFAADRTVGVKATAAEINARI